MMGGSSDFEFEAPDASALSSLHMALSVARESIKRLDFDIQYQREDLARLERMSASRARYVISLTEAIAKLSAP